MPKDKLQINGQVKRWAGKGSSGKNVWRVFCPECGSPISHEPDANPVISAVKGGAFDTEIKKTLKPVSGSYPIPATELKVMNLSKTLQFCL